MKPLRWLKLWCRHCKYKTAHECLPDIDTGRYTLPLALRSTPEELADPPTSQGDYVPGKGLLWRCDVCRRSEVFSAHQASTGNPLHAQT